MAENIDPNANAQGGLIGVTAAMLAIAVIAVVLRTYSVVFDSLRKFGLDDLFATLALVCIPEPKDSLWQAIAANRPTTKQPFYVCEVALVFWWIKLGLVSLEDLAKAGKIEFASGYLFT
jgi:hypothetical protein